METKILQSLNDQLNLEMNAAYKYFAMATFMKDINYDGMAKWMELQAKEELAHMSKIHTFIFNRDQTAIIQSLPKPKQEWNSILSVFEEALENEKIVSRSIFELTDLAVHHKDYATRQFLNWFIEEQVEEEASISTIINRLKRIGDNQVALDLLDNELGEREED